MFETGRSTFLFSFDIMGMFGLYYLSLYL